MQCVNGAERYLHVSKKALVNIIGPLDDLMNNKDIDWQILLTDIQNV